MSFAVLVSPLGLCGQVVADLHLNALFHFFSSGKGNAIAKHAVQSCMMVQPAAMQARSSLKVVKVDYPLCGRRMGWDRTGRRDRSRRV